MITPDELRDLLRKNNLEKYEQQYLDHLKPAIFLERTAVSDEAEIPIGSSKLGGSPDVPPDFVWQSWHGVPLTFIAQFRLSEVAPYDVDGLLPREGMLYFFWETQFQPDHWFPEQGERSAAQVLYLLDEGVPLVRHPHPIVIDAETLRAFATEDPWPWPHIEDIDAVVGHMRPLNPCKVAFTSTYTLPSPYGWGLQAVGEESREDLQRVKFEVWHAIDTREPKHYLLGVADVIQNPMEDQCEAIYTRWLQNEGATEDPRSSEERERDWRLLLQIDDDEGPEKLGIYYRDSGYLYFWIRQQDLLARDFSRMVVINHFM